MFLFLLVPTHPVLPGEGEGEGEGVREGPVKRDKKWVHMDEVEREKMEWMKDLPPPPTAGDNKVSPLMLLYPIRYINLYNLHTKF